MAFIVGAAALALGAVIVALFLPARARDDEDSALAGIGTGVSETPDEAVVLVGGQASGNGGSSDGGQQSGSTVDAAQDLGPPSPRTQ